MKSTIIAFATISILSVSFIVLLIDHDNKIIKLQRKQLDSATKIINICNDECDKWANLYFKTEGQRVSDSLYFDNALFNTNK